jgi:hypothetical protein
MRADPVRAAAWIAARRFDSKEAPHPIIRILNRLLLPGGIRAVDNHGLRPRAVATTTLPDHLPHPAAARAALPLRAAEAAAAVVVAGIAERTYYFN